MLGLAATANPPAQWHVYLSALVPLTLRSVHFTLTDRDLSELIASCYRKGGYFVTAGYGSSAICYWKFSTSVTAAAPPINVFQKICVYIQIRFCNWIHLPRSQVLPLNSGRCACSQRCSFKA